MTVEGHAVGESSLALPPESGQRVKIAHQIEDDGLARRGDATDIQVPSSVVNAMLRVGTIGRSVSGAVFFFVAESLAGAGDWALREIAVSRPDRAKAVRGARVIWGREVRVASGEGRENFRHSAPRGQGRVRDGGDGDQGAGEPVRNNINGVLR